MSDEMRYCGRCHTDRPVSDYSTRCARTGALQSWCRECTATYRRDRYARMRSEQIDKIIDDRAKLARRRRKLQLNRQHATIDLIMRDLLDRRGYIRARIARESGINVQTITRYASIAVDGGRVEARTVRRLVHWYTGLVSDPRRATRRAIS